MFRKKTPVAMRLTLRVLARLLSYPDAALRAQVPELIQALEQERALDPARLAELRALAQQLAALDRYTVEERYVATFDRSRRCSLMLFEHVHGDSRARGQALVDLLQTYEQGGVFFRGPELPDHLPVVLEFASTQAPETARAFLGETAEILQALFSILVQDESPYACVLAAVLELAGETAEAVRVARVPEPDPDADWAEPPAFDGAGMGGQGRPAHRVHMKAPEIRFVETEDTSHPEGALQ